MPHLRGVALRPRVRLRYRNGLLLAWVSTAKISGKTYWRTD